MVNMNIQLMEMHYWTPLIVHKKLLKKVKL